MLAALSASIKNGIGQVFLSVILERIKPGQITLTEIFSARRLLRNASPQALTQALLALYEGQDITSLEEGYYFGFGVDAGLAALADAEIMQEFLDYQDKYATENPSNEFYTDELEPMFEEGYKKYPEANIDFIDYVIPETDHHLVIMESGFGDGVYPVYFGYSENGELCCAVVQFIFPTEM